MTDSLKKMLKSVDWSKMMSNGDARNALVGSALGGLMLGGASLMQDRDPEESKAAPVGDALMGALLGGAAGYGIPKGLALFRDSGTLAPDDDPLPKAPGAAATAKALAPWGAVAGSGAVAVKDTPAAARALGRLFGKNYTIASDLQKNGPDMLRDLVRDMVRRSHEGNASPDAFGRTYRNGFAKNVLHPKRFLMKQNLKVLNPLAVLRELGNEPGASAARGWRGIPKFTHGSRYATKEIRNLVTGGKIPLKPLTRMLLRHGKYGAIGALLAGGAGAAVGAFRGDK